VNYFQDKEIKDNKKSYDFPNPIRKKDNTFFLQYFEAMYAEYVRDRGGIPYSRRFDFNLYDL